MYEDDPRNDLEVVYIRDERQTDAILAVAHGLVQVARAKHLAKGMPVQNDDTKELVDILDEHLDTLLGILTNLEDN
jgi:hypothetical protein